MVHTDFAEQTMHGDDPTAELHRQATYKLTCSGREENLLCWMPVSSLREGGSDGGVRHV